MRYSEFTAYAAGCLEKAVFYTRDERFALARRLLFALSQSGSSSISGFDAGDICIPPVVDSVQLALHGEDEVPRVFLDLLEKALARLAGGEPLEYVVGFAEFCGHRFNVNRSTLIPRPETEELVAIVRDHVESVRKRECGNCACGRELRLLDLCTGSGCIAWSLLLEGCKVAGCDISAEALKVASSQPLEEIVPPGSVKPLFFECDILRADAVEAISRTLAASGWRSEGSLVDVIVSNPPYVTRSQVSCMRPNVLNWEPEQALFVEDSDPLLFYEAIADIAFSINGGSSPAPALFLEINETMGERSVDLLSEKGWKSVECRKDVFEKKRFVVAK